MIIGISEARRLPRLGKIHLGIKAISSKGVEYPKQVDYFVVPPEVAEVYGEQPKKLDIVLPSENPEVFFPQYYKRYSKTHGLQCKGDGLHASVIGEEGAMVEILCDRATCEYALKKECKPVANLLFILPKVKGLGVYQIDTSSVNNIINLNSEISLLTKKSGILLSLVREPAEIKTKDGKMQTMYFVHIRSPYSLMEIQNQSNKALPSEEVIAVATDEEAPEDETPEEEHTIEGSVIDRSIFSLMKELGIETLSPVTAMLASLFPSGDWTGIKNKEDFKVKLSDEEKQKVLDYLSLLKEVPSDKE